MMAMVLTSKTFGADVVVASTHLKARKGDLMRQFRNEQGRDVAESLARFAGPLPVICSGDFNAEPDEPVHATLEGDPTLRFAHEERPH
jgi:endonuclease/exonuclease/phosphatase family metal-dependent hydrolase